MPDQETVSDYSQGVQLKTLQQLPRYWETDYDWRKVEARLKAVPNFITEIDGLDIHFIHVRSKHENALPLIVTHGWPGSIIEQLKIIDPLTNPTAHGGSASDAFHLVIPSMPGYGFSGSRRRRAGTRPHRARVDRADEAPWIHAFRRAGWRLGRDRYRLMGVQASGIARYSHQHAQRDSCRHRQGALPGAPAPSGLSADERSRYEQLVFVYKHGLRLQMGLRPQALYGFADSPVGLADFLDHDARSLELISRAFDGQTEGLTRDDVLDNVTLYWLTNTSVSGARLYWECFENKVPFFSLKGVKSRRP